MTEVEKYETPAGTLVDWGRAAKAAHELANGLVQTAFAPDQFRGKPLDATAAILAGAEVGLSPLQALNSTFVIGGKPAYYARTMVALVQAQGHEVWTDQETPDKVTVCGQRRGSDRVEKVTVTLDQARKAGWTRNRKYETEPAAMLYARAASAVCRRIAADALLGIPYTVEELEAPDAPEAKRKVSRATRDVPESVKRSVAAQQAMAQIGAEKSEAPAQSDEPPAPAEQAQLEAGDDA